MQVGAMILMVGKISLVLLLLLLALALMRHESAARRTLAAQLSLLALLLLPLLWALLPASKILLPLAWSALTDAPLTIPDLPGIAWFAPPPETGERAIPWVQLCLGIYAAVAGLLMLGIFWNLRRLQTLPARLPRQGSTEIRAEALLAWQASLAQLRQRYAISRPVRLLVSDHVRAPISWGIFHPVIMVDVNTINHFPPDDVLRHELAHIANFDWPGLILGRLVCAMYWFHPLVWLMFRHLTFNMECKTDDVVLTQGARPSDYAQTLMQISQQAHAPEPVATPLAGRGRSLMARLLAILEPQQPRQAVSARLWGWSVLLTVAIAFPLGSLAFIGEQITWPDALFKRTAHQTAQAGKAAADELDKLNNPNFTALAQALRTANYDQRHALAIESFRQRGAIAPLVLALHDSNPKVRRLALWGLSEMRFDETGPLLALMLKDTDPLVRGEAARALAELGDQAWTASILPLLQDPNAFTRASAAHALGDLQDPRSRAALQAGLRDGHPDVVEEMRWALDQLNQ